jgi:hypothetical protein
MSENKVCIYGFGGLGCGTVKSVESAAKSLVEKPAFAYADTVAATFKQYETDPSRSYLMGDGDGKSGGGKSWTETFPAIREEFANGGFFVKHPLSERMNIFVGSSGGGVSGAALQAAAEKCLSEKVPFVLVVGVSSGLSYVDAENAFKFLGNLDYFGGVAEATVPALIVVSSAKGQYDPTVPKRMCESMVRIADMVSGQSYGIDNKDLARFMNRTWADGNTGEGLMCLSAEDPGVTPVDGLMRLVPADGSLEAEAGPRNWYKEYHVDGITPISMSISRQPIEALFKEISEQMEVLKREKVAPKSKSLSNGFKI